MLNDLLSQPAATPPAPNPTPKATTALALALAPQLAPPTASISRIVRMRAGAPVIAGFTPPVVTLVVTVQNAKRCVGGARVRGQSVAVAAALPPRAFSAAAEKASASL